MVRKGIEKSLYDKVEEKFKKEKGLVRATPLQVTIEIFNDYLKDDEK